jgi:hypothetical protein
VVSGERSAYIDLAMSGPVKFYKSVAGSLSRRWKIDKNKTARIVRNLSNAGLIRISADKIHAVEPHKADPTSFFEEGGNWQRLRQAVFERDNFTCVYCGATEAVLHADHVHPRSRGGRDEMENLVTACASCNLSKGSKSVEEWRK